jgi:hypothetical protein
VVAAEEQGLGEEFVSYLHARRDRSGALHTPVLGWAPRALLEPLSDAIVQLVSAKDASFADDTSLKMLTPGTGQTKTPLTEHTVARATSVARTPGRKLYVTLVETAKLNGIDAAA